MAGMAEHLALPSDAECPLCGQGVACGQQCSLCQRWFHQRPGASPAFAAKEDMGPDHGAPCRGLPPPYLLPFFCAACVARVVAVAQTEGTALPASRDALSLQRFIDDDSDSDDSDAGSLAVAAGEAGEAGAVDPGRKEATLELRRLKQSALQEVVRMDSSHRRASRMADQQAWAAVFTRRMLRRLRRVLAVDYPVYAEHGPTVGASEEALLVPAEVAALPLAPAPQEPTAEAQCVQRYGRAHLEDIAAARAETLTAQRRLWTAEALDYGGIGPDRVARAAVHPSLDPHYLPQASRFRLSQVVVDLQVDSEDDAATA